MERALGKEDEARNGVGDDQIIQGLECRFRDFEFYSVDQYFSSWIPVLEF